MLGVAPCRPLMAPHLAPTRTDVGAGVRAAATSVGSSTVGWQLAIDSGFADRDHPQVVGRQMLRCGDRVEPAADIWVPEDHDRAPVDHVGERREGRCCCVGSTTRCPSPYRDKATDKPSGEGTRRSAWLLAGNARPPAESGGPEPQARRKGARGPAGRGARRPGPDGPACRRRRAARGRRAKSRLGPASANRVGPRGRLSAACIEGTGSWGAGCRACKPAGSRVELR